MEGEGLPGEAEVGSLGWPLGGGTTRGGGRREKEGLLLEGWEEC